MFKILDTTLWYQGKTLYLTQILECFSSFNVVKIIEFIYKLLMKRTLIQRESCIHFRSQRCCEEKRMLRMGSDTSQSPRNVHTGNETYDWLNLTFNSLKACANPTELGKFVKGEYGLKLKIHSKRLTKRDTQ